MKRHIIKSLSCLMSVNLIVFTGGMNELPSAFAEYSIKQTQWNGHRYAVIEKELKPLEAEEYCKSLGGYLAAVTSQEEQDFIAGLASEVDYESFWIGASDDGSEDEWYWLNGEKWDYTAWYPGGSVGTNEPNNGLGAGEDYCCMSKARDYLWVDAFGGYNGYTTTCYFICEWDDISKDNKTKWNGHQYQIIDNGMTWDEAKEYCKSLDGHLATVTSEDEEKLIESLIADGTKDAYWLGGRDINLELTWITGEEVTYTKWGANQPDNYEEDGGDCVSVFRTSNHGVGANDWADMSNKAEPFEKSQLGFICEWDSNTNPEDLRSAFERIESEDYDDATDRVHSADNYGTGTCIGWIADKHYIRYNNIDFGNGANAAIINAAENYYDSELEIHIDALDGKCIGVWSVPNTESWYDFYEYICPVSLVTGVHDVFLVCNAEPSGVDVINLDYFTFISTTSSIPVSDFMLGDVNEDKIIDGRDATDVLTEYAKTSTGQESKYTEEQKKAADVNNDGIIDGRDATAILTYYAKTSVGETMTLEEFIESIK